MPLYLDCALLCKAVHSGQAQGSGEDRGQLCVAPLFISLVTFLLSLIPTKSFTTTLCIALMYKFSKTLLQTQGFPVFSSSQFSSVW